MNTCDNVLNQYHLLAIQTHSCNSQTINLVNKANNITLIENIIFLFDY